MYTGLVGKPFCTKKTLSGVKMMWAFPLKLKGIVAA